MDRENDVVPLTARSLRSDARSRFFIGVGACSPFPFVVAARRSRCHR
jgi:hypothetical protein